MCWLQGGGVTQRRFRGTKHERSLHSHGKRPTAFNRLIKFRTLGHGGLDWARHSGVSSVSHDQVSHTHMHTHIRPRLLWLDRMTQQEDRKQQDGERICVSYVNNKSLPFHILSTTFNFNPEAQLSVAFLCSQMLFSHK